MIGLGLHRLKEALIDSELPRYRNAPRLVRPEKFTTDFFQPSLGAPHPGDECIAQSLLWLGAHGNGL